MKYKRPRDNLRPPPGNRDNQQDDQGKRRKDEINPRRSSAIFGFFRNVAGAAGNLMTRQLVMEQENVREIPPNT